MDQIIDLYIKLTTKEMVDYFLERTELHRNLVKKYGMKIGKDFSEHDPDKTSTGALPYIHLTWQNANKDFKVHPKIQEDIQKATFIHIKTNRHHPEYWCESVEHSLIGGTVQQELECSDMPNSALEELCADWCAMSEELGGSPLDWAKNHIGKKWIFNKEQEQHIYKTLDKMWEDK